MVAIKQDRRTPQEKVKRIREARGRGTRVTPDRVSAVRVATPNEGRHLFEQQSQRELNISGDEFLCRWDRGDYRNDNSDEGRAARRLAMLIPFARRTEV